MICDNKLWIIKLELEKNWIHELSNEISDSEVHKTPRNLNFLQVINVIMLIDWFVMYVVQIRIIIHIWMWIVWAYMDDELEKLLTEVNGEVEVCIHSSKEGGASGMPCMCRIHSLNEGECEWYTCVYVYPFVEGKGVRMV